MGTAIDFLVADKVPAEQANAAIDAALAEITRIEDMMSDWKDSSALSALNRAAGVSPVSVPAELMFMLKEAKRIAELTRGKFDITYKGAGKLWDFQAVPPRLPDPDAVRTAIQRIDYRKLELDEAAGTAFLKEKGMAVGLGGIAKGYAVDQAVKLMRANGLKHFVINAGGDLHCSGRRDGKLWWVGIRDPRAATENVAVLPLANLSVATSGDYERYLMIYGKRYCHILDPQTGYPAQHCRSVSILADNTYLADAFATGVFVLGPEKGLALIESLDGVEGMIIDHTGGLHVSAGLRKKPSEK